jgi:hypothetical protein
MKSNYTRFGKNLFTSGNIYDYVAFDEKNDSVLRVAFRSSFPSDLPAEIAVTSSSNFTISVAGCTHVTILDVDFWKIYSEAIDALALVNPVELFSE